MDFKVIEELINNIPVKDEKIDTQYQEFITDLLNQPKTDTRDTIERSAKANLYHDFGPSMFPKLMLVNHLGEAGYLDMKKKAINGDYDF